MVGRPNPTTCNPVLLPKSHNATVPYSIMLHIVTVNYTCVRISVTKRWIVRYLPNVLWDLWVGYIVCSMYSIGQNYSTQLFVAWLSPLEAVTISVSVATHCWHDDVIKWKHFPRYWPFVRGIHRSPVNSLHKGQWRGVLMFSLICVWINGWENTREAGDFRRYRVHCDVIVMDVSFSCVAYTSRRSDWIYINVARWLSMACSIHKPMYNKIYGSLKTQSTVPMTVNEVPIQYNSM